MKAEEGRATQTEEQSSTKGGAGAATTAGWRMRPR